MGGAGERLDVGRSAESVSGIPEMCSILEARFERCEKQQHFDLAQSLATVIAVAKRFQTNLSSTALLSAAICLDSL